MNTLMDSHKRHRLDGAFRPWLDRLLSALLAKCPLPEGSVMKAADDLPKPRVVIRPSVNADKPVEYISSPNLDAGAVYHEATLACNRQITAEDWYQDVRHFEFTFQDDIL